MHEVRGVTFEDRDRIYRECADAFYAYTDTTPQVFKQAIDGLGDVTAFFRLFDSIGWAPTDDRESYEVALDDRMAALIAQRIAQIDEYLSVGESEDAWAPNEWSARTDSELDTRAALARLLPTEVAV